MAKKKSDPASTVDVWEARTLDAWRALEIETDRGCVLVAAEWLSDHLAALLRTKFSLEDVPKGEQDDLLNGFYAPLSAFGVRASVCRAFGIIPARTFNALTAVRKIRNHCAHSQGVVSFTDKKIEHWVRVLRESMTKKWQRANPDADPRTLVVETWRLLTIDLLKVKMRINRRLAAKHKRWSQSIRKKIAKQTSNRPRA